MGEIQIHPTVEQNTSYLISEVDSRRRGDPGQPAGQPLFNEMETRDKVSGDYRLPEHMRTSSLTNTYGRKTKRQMSTSPALSPAPAHRVS
jgi:hypothetical protein